jgi:hypothetical protein
VTAHHLIKKDAYNVDLLKALYQFRNHFEPKGSQKQGKHFNHQLLAEAAELYDQNYERFRDWNSPKNIFCWQKVFGGVQRLVPACDAQSIAYEPWYLFNEEAKLPRSFKFRYGGGKYYPLGVDPSKEIGHNRAVERGKACKQPMYITHKLVYGGIAADLTNLMSSKNNSAAALSSSLSTKSPSQFKHQERG